VLMGTFEDMLTFARRIANESQRYWRKIGRLN
jgi:hypothetical protein